MQLRIGIIGCGGIAAGHAESWKEVGAKVVAVTDINKDAALAMAKTTGADVFADYKELIDGAKPDAISICTPPAFHEEAAVYALKAGVHVLCEKPLTVSTESAHRIRDAAKASSALFMPAFRHRFIPAIVNLKKFLDSGTIGDIVIFNNIFGGPAFNMEGRWFTKKEISGGGTLLDTNSHSVDLFRYLVGEIIQQSGVMHRHFKTTDVEDAGIIDIKAENGAIGSLQSSFVLGAGIAVISIFGTKGRVLFDYENPDKIQYLLLGETEWKEQATEFSGGFDEQIKHFSGAIKGEFPLSCTIEDGVRMTEVIMSVYAANS